MFLVKVSFTFEVDRMSSNRLTPKVKPKPKMNPEGQKEALNVAAETVAKSLTQNTDRGKNLIIEIIKILWDIEITTCY